MLLLDTLFLRCGVNALHASLDEAAEKAANVDGVFVCLRKTEEIEPAGRVCRKIREISKTKPLWVAADAAMDLGDGFAECSIVRHPVTVTGAVESVLAAQKKPEREPVAEGVEN